MNNGASPTIRPSLRIARVSNSSLPKWCHQGIVQAGETNGGADAARFQSASHSKACDSSPAWVTSSSTWPVTSVSDRITQDAIDNMRLRPNLVLRQLLI